MTDPQCRPTELRQSAAPIRSRQALRESRGSGARGLEKMPKVGLLPSPHERSEWRGGGGGGGVIERQTRPPPLTPPPRRCAGGGERAAYAASRSAHSLLNKILNSTECPRCGSPCPIWRSRPQCAGGMRPASPSRRSNSPSPRAGLHGGVGEGHVDR